MRLAPDIVCVCLCKVGGPGTVLVCYGILGQRVFSPQSVHSGNMSSPGGGPPHFITCDMWSQKGVGTWVGVWTAPLPCRNPAQRGCGSVPKSPDPRRGPPSPASTLLSTQSGGGSSEYKQLNGVTQLSQVPLLPSFSLCPHTPSLTGLRRAGNRTQSLPGSQGQ